MTILQKPYAMGYLYDIGDTFTLSATLSMTIDNVFIPWNAIKHLQADATYKVEKRQRIYSLRVSATESRVLNEEELCSYKKCDHIGT